MPEKLAIFEEDIFTLVLVIYFLISHNDLFTKLRYCEEVSIVLVPVSVTLHSLEPRYQLKNEEISNSLKTKLTHEILYTQRFSSHLTENALCMH